MAQKVLVTMTCDMHEGEVEATETVAFGLDGSNYEIDLCDEHASDLREKIAPMVGAARAIRSSGRPTGNRAGTRARAAGHTGPDPAEVRAWATANGFTVPERGRLPKEVTTAYAAAHGAAKAEAPKVEDKAEEKATTSEDKPARKRNGGKAAEKATG